ncbi:MAG: YidC/Oxa1 family membrane protein insertase [Treponema sp.]|nr:YidC/Oxa1 family membrane protein insertase [Treponema sp.]
MINALYTIIIYPLYQIVEFFYSLADAILSNPGLAVIGVSLGISFLCLPMYIIAEKWQDIERQTHVKLKPGIDRIKKAFKGDEQYMILSTYYRQNHYHPMMALRSSISLLIQIPFFIAAYQYLSTFQAIKGQPFLFIKDMGAPDALFHIGNFPVNVLPVAMTLINVIAGAIYSKGHALKEKLQIYLMAAFFLIFLYDSPSGLVLYWTMNNLFSLAKNVFYKLKKPARALYICLCAVYIAAVWFLLFKHSGFMYRRLLVIGVLTLIPLTPVILKGIKHLLDKTFADLKNNDKIRDTVFFLSGITLTVLCGYVIPSFVVSSSPMEFSFVDEFASPFFFLRNSLFQCIGICIFWPCCLYYLFGKRIKTVITILLSSLALCGIVNTFIFGGEYGAISNILTFENSGMIQPSFKFALISLLSCFAVITGLFLIIKFRLFKVITTLFAVLAFSLTAVSIANSIPISKGYAEVREIRANNENLKSADFSSVFHFSKENKNVIIFMLDRAINGLVPYMFEEKPILKQQFDGFVRYENTVSYSGNTLLGAPPLYGGYEYTPAQINARDQEALVDKHNECLKVLPVLFDQNGYTSTVTDMSWANYKWVSDLRIYKDYPSIKCCPTMRVYDGVWLKKNPNVVGYQKQSNQLKRNFLWLSFFKIMPPVTREFIYEDGHWWKPRTGTHHLSNFINCYSALDLLPELSDNSGDKPTFTIIVNEATHEPVKTGSPDYNLTTLNDSPAPFYGDIPYQGNMAAFLKLGEFMDYLKEIGVYDNTRIILVSDHGGATMISKFAEKDCPRSYNPLLLVKDFNAHGEIRVDETFMTNADTPLLAMDGLIENPINPFTKKSMKDAVKKDKVYISTDASWTPEKHNKTKFIIKHWRCVHDDIFNSDNWSDVTEEEAMASVNK